MQTKKNTKNKVLHWGLIVLVTLLLVGIVGGGYIWFRYFYMPVQNLQKILDASDWREYKDSKLGYSYTVPDSWVTSTKDYTSLNDSPEFGAEYKVSEHALPQWYINVIFYKNPKKEGVNYLQDGNDPQTTVDPQSRTINGVEYIVIHYPPRLESGFKAGNYLLAKDYSLLVEVRLGYPSDRTSGEEKKEEEIVNKIFNSIKKI